MRVLVDIPNPPVHREGQTLEDDALETLSLLRGFCRGLDGFTVELTNTVKVADVEIGQFVAGVDLHNPDRYWRIAYLSICHNTIRLHTDHTTREYAPTDRVPMMTRRQVEVARGG